MSLLERMQRSVSLKKPAGVLPSGRKFDPMDYLYQPSGAAIGGQFEVATADLASVSQRILKQSGQVYALEQWRLRAFRDIRFQWQQMNGGRPGDLFGNTDLGLIENPWPNGSTADLLTRMLLDADLLGTGYITRHPRFADQLRWMRSDWVFTVWGSESEPELFGDALDAELLGYVYAPRQRGAFNPDISEILLPEDVATFVPMPDPEAHSRGMSWLTPILREIGADMDTIRHKQSFFRNGASARLAVKVDESVEEDDFKRMVAMIDRSTVGTDNAYRTLYIAGGADPVAMNFNLKDADFSKVLAGGEVRLANAAGVPAPVAGLAEALQGSSLNAGNLQAEIQLFVDLTIRDLWARAAEALQSILPTPPSSRLWYDSRDTALLGDNEADAASVRSSDATTMSSLIMQGFAPDSVVAYVSTGDVKQLKHTGRTSVQLQGGDAQAQARAADTTTTEPGTTAPTEGE